MTGKLLCLVCKVCYRIISPSFLYVLSSMRPGESIIEYIKAWHAKVYKKYRTIVNVEGLVVNDYWKQNNGIWTPWIVRYKSK